MLASQSWKIGNLELSPDVTLRVGERYVFRRAVDGQAVAYSVTILVDPSLGVPCNTPDAETQWGSRTPIYMMLDENGDPNGAGKLKSLCLISNNEILVPGIN